MDFSINFMKININIHQLKIYHNYDGDIDGILRMGKKSELNVFGSEIDVIWSEITNLNHGIELIKKGNVSKEYVENSINKIKSICDNEAFKEMTKDMPSNKPDLIEIIKDYQISADKAVKIFKEKYKVDDILEGWHRGVYEQLGKLVDEGLNFYAFHGIGLAAHFKDKIVDFDFAYFPEPRHDGFDLWRLTNFIRNQRNKYPDYDDDKKIEREFNELIKNEVIAKPKLENSTTLYFFKNTLTTEIIDETERTINISMNNSWWRKFF